MLGGLEGEFAFVFWEARARRLWFGRDRLGRRSLLVKQRGACQSGAAGASEGWGQWLALCSSLGHVPPECLTGLDDNDEEADVRGVEEAVETQAGQGGKVVGMGGWQEVTPDGFYCLRLDVEGQVRKQGEEDETATKKVSCWCDATKNVR